MKNLAGVQNCDEYIRIELQKADVPIIEEARSSSEVPYTLHGELGPFIFRRAWYYWMVSGDVPLLIAEELYNNPNGVKDIRAAGHCGAPHPKEWAMPKFENLPKAFEHITYGEIASMCNKGILNVERFVSNYHIDTQEGLNFFVQTLRKHNLV